MISIAEITNCKMRGCQKKSWPNLRPYTYKHFHGEIEENNEIPKDSRTPTRELPQGSLKYVAEVSTTRLLGSLRYLPR